MGFGELATPPKTGRWNSLMFQGLRTPSPYARCVVGLHRYVPNIRYSDDMTKIFKKIFKKAKSQCLGKGPVFYVFKLNQLTVSKVGEYSRSLMLLRNEELTQHVSLI